MTAPKHDVVYVDLIEDEPMTLVEFGESVDEPFDDVHELEQAYRHYIDRFQPWRWHSSCEGNHEVLGQGERWFNEADAEHNIRLQFAEGTIVYLRRAERGNEMLRMAYPSPWGDTTVIGPECFANADGSVICWRGVNYVPQAVA